MPWQRPIFSFTADTVARLAPASAGVYVLWRTGRWVYAGTTDNIRARLLSLLSGDNESIAREQPTEFGYELIPGDVERRVARCDELIQELAPICR